MNLPDIPYKNIDIACIDCDACIAYSDVCHECFLDHVVKEDDCSIKCLMQDCDTCYLRFKCITSGESIMVKPEEIKKAAESQAFKVTLAINKIFNYG